MTNKEAGKIFFEVRILRKKLKSDGSDYYCLNLTQDSQFESNGTSHSAYVATSTESNGVKIDGLLPPNFL